jgi:hypothetical protein
MLFAGLCCRSFLRSKSVCGAQRHVFYDVRVVVCGYWYAIPMIYVYLYIFIQSGVCFLSGHVRCVLHCAVVRCKFLYIVESVYVAGVT